jgi:hypothetical protein
MIFYNLLTFEISLQVGTCATQVLYLQVFTHTWTRINQKILMESNKAAVSAIAEFYHRILGTG